MLIAIFINFPDCEDLATLDATAGVGCNCGRNFGAHLKDGPRFQFTRRCHRRVVAPGRPGQLPGSRSSRTINYSKKKSLTYVTRTFRSIYALSSRDTLCCIASAAAAFGVLDSVNGHAMREIFSPKRHAPAATTRPNPCRIALSSSSPNSLIFP